MPDAIQQFGYSKPNATFDPELDRTIGRHHTAAHLAHPGWQVRKSHAIKSDGKVTVVQRINNEGARDTIQLGGGFRTFAAKKRAANGVHRHACRSRWPMFLMLNLRADCFVA